MEVFKGWYRKSFSSKGTVWHRVIHVDSILAGRQMAYTVCGRSIPTTKCDFNIKPDYKCMQCEKSPGVVIETGRSFVPVGSTSIRTKTAAIAELKRLLKPRIYYIKIWKPYGVHIIATWESDVSIDIETETKIITQKRTKRIFTLEQVQVDLGHFKSEIDCLCDATKTLALAAKRKKNLKGRLTEEESQTYFEKLLCEAEK